MALRPLHLQRLREEGLHEYLMKPKAHFVFGCPWPPGHPFGTKHEVEALKHAEKVHHYEPKTSAEGRMLSLEEFLNSFPKNQTEEEGEEKKHSAGAIPRKLAATDANTKTNFQAKFYTRQTKITFRGTTKVVLHGTRQVGLHGAHQVRLHGSHQVRLHGTHQVGLHGTHQVGLLQKDKKIPTFQLHFKTL